MDCPDVCLEAFWLQEWEWVLEDCHKMSCWKNSIGLSVPRPCGSDAYVCSKSFWVCLTVVYWLLECNKVPSSIENPEYVTIYLKDIGFKGAKLLACQERPYVSVWCYWSPEWTKYRNKVLHTLSVPARCNTREFIVLITGAEEHTIKFSPLHTLCLLRQRIFRTLYFRTREIYNLSSEQEMAFNNHTKQVVM
jgi:hypothetical protein